MYYSTFWILLPESSSGLLAAKGVPTNDKFMQYGDIQYIWIASFLAMTSDSKLY